MKLSIITPTYNSEKFILKTLKSMFSLSCYVELEHIIIDGGSTDSTIDIIKDYTYSNIHYHPKVIHEKCNLGMYRAINEGMKVMTGDIWACLNSDDEYNPEVVLEALKLFKDPSVDVVYGNVEMIDSNNKLIYKLYLPKKFSLDYLIQKEYSLPILQPAVFIRTSLIRQVGYFNIDYKYASDYDYMIRLGQYTTPKHFNGFTTKYRMHENSITWGKETHKIQIQESTKISQKYQPFVIEKDISYPEICMYIRQIRLCNIHYMFKRVLRL